MITKGQIMTIIRLWLLAILVAVALVATTTAGVLYAQGARGLCPTEDSVSCVWINDGHLLVNGPDA